MSRVGGVCGQRGHRPQGRAWSQLSSVGAAYWMECAASLFQAQPSKPTESMAAFAVGSAAIIKHGSIACSQVRPAGPHLCRPSSAASCRATGVRIGRCTHTPGEKSVAVAAFSTNTSSSTSTVRPPPPRPAAAAMGMGCRAGKHAHEGKSGVWVRRCRSWHRLSVGDKRRAPAGLLAPANALAAAV